jgi:hypothetical protein
MTSGMQNSAERNFASESLQRSGFFKSFRRRRPKTRQIRQAAGLGTANFEEKPRESIQGNGSLVGTCCGMKAIEIARHLNRDASS